MNFGKVVYIFATTPLFFMDSICSWSVNDLIYEMHLIKNNFQQNLQYKFAYVCYIAFKMVPLWNMRSNLNGTKPLKCDFLLSFMLCWLLFFAPKERVNWPSVNVYIWKSAKSFSDRNKYVIRNVLYDFSFTFTAKT